MRKLILKISGCLLGLAVIGIAGAYTLDWKEIDAAIYANAIVIPLYFIYRYRQTKIAKVNSEYGRTPERGFVWNEGNRFALYSSIWVWMFCATAAFLLAEAGQLALVTGIVLICLAVALTALLFAVSRKMEGETSSEPASFGSIQWDGQSKNVVYGTAKMWIRIASLAVLLYLLDLWIPIVQIGVYALASLSPVYYFLRSKRSHRVDL